MQRLMFDMWLHRPSVGGIMFSFTDGKGRYEETWFGGPPNSIDHVSSDYIYNRFSNARTEHHCNFIKHRYKKKLLSSCRLEEGDSE